MPDFMNNMKVFTYLALANFLIATNLHAKSQIGEYFLGFGYALADGASDDREGDFLRLTARSANGSNSDLGVYLDYGQMESVGQDAKSWNLGVDYLAIFNSSGGHSFRLTPYLGGGVGYLNEEHPIRLAKDGFTWSLLFGSELQFSNSLSLNVGGRFFGLWSEFGENEFTADASLIWWFNNIHGMSFEYQRAVEAELNYFTLKYLYSWQ